MEQPSGNQDDRPMRLSNWLNHISAERISAFRSEEN
jgi:hypothetical protein